MSNTDGTQGHFRNALTDEMILRYPVNLSSISIEGNGFIEGAKWAEKHFESEVQRLRDELEFARNSANAWDKLTPVQRLRAISDPSTVPAETFLKRCLEDVQKERDGLRDELELVKKKRREELDYIDELQKSQAKDWAERDSLREQAKEQQEVVIKCEETLSFFAGDMKRKLHTECLIEAKAVLEKYKQPQP